MVFHQGQKFRFSLGHHHIRPEHWDSIRQRMMIGSPDCDTINRSIDQWVGRIILYYTTGISHREEPTIKGLQSHLFPDKQPITRSSSPNSVVKWFNRFTKEHTNNGRPLSPNTIKSYKVVLNSWKSFEKHTKTRFVLDDLVQEVKNESTSVKKVVQDYHRFLVSGNLNGSPCSDNSVRKYLKILNTFLRWCEEQTGKTYQRKTNIQGEIVAKHTFSLTEYEIKRIQEVELTRGSKLDVVRDMMLVGIYTGLRHSEWMKVRPELWREPSQLITSQKTGKVCLVVHREPLRKVLMKYEKTGFRSSITNIQKVNTQIKEVCKLSGLDREVSKVKSIDGVEHHETFRLYEVISTHTFRRTKITRELNMGRPLREIVLETGQDEEISRKHYDRPNLFEHVQNLGIERVE